VIPATRTRSDHERVESETGGPALDERADEKQRERVRQQVAD